MFLYFVQPVFFHFFKTNLQFYRPHSMSDSTLFLRYLTVFELTLNCLTFSVCFYFTRVTTLTLGNQLLLRRNFNRLVFCVNYSVRKSSNYFFKNEISLKFSFSVGSKPGFLFLNARARRSLYYIMWSPT